MEHRAITTHHDRDASLRIGRPLALIQGTYWTVTGIWPILHRRSFEVLTGPKTDYWLAETAGLLIASCGIVLLVAYTNRRIAFEVGLLACLSAVSLAGIDVFYVVKGRISGVYFLDAVVEVALAGGWMVWAGKKRATQRLLR